MSKYYHLGLIGYPLGHSYSPGLHHAALAALELDGEYHLYPIPLLPSGEKELHTLLEELRQEKLQGLNVTIPHKQNVIPFLDILTPTALAIGAVNVIYARNNHLIGDNTDSPAFWNDLNRQFPLLDRSTKKALVLGAGGSARAVVYTLLEDGWQITIAARRLSQAQPLANSWGNTQIDVIQLDSLETTNMDGMTLIINATPVGMTPNVSQSPLPEIVCLPESTALYDLIYNPAQTQLMNRFQQVGLPAVNGAGMLVEQAALSLERWTGTAAPRKIMLANMTEQIQKGNNDEP